MSLPLLIKEAIDFYRWREGMKWLNKDYAHNVEIVDNGLYWVHHGRFWTRHIKICGLSDSDPKYNVQRFVTNTFYPKVVGMLPQKYHYTSGMQNRSGYTDRNKFWWDSNNI